MQVKPIIGLLLLFNIFTMSFFSVYWGYLGIFQGNRVCLVYILVLMVYQIFFATYNQTYVNLFRYLRPTEYFKEFTLLIEDGRLKQSKCLLTFHPHGVLSCGLIGNINLKLDNINILASRFALFVPFLGMTLKWWNTLPVSPKNFNQYLSEGKNIGMVPGGYEEATLTSRYKNRVYIKNRKGFIKYALQHGYTIYPTYTFNENRLYYTYEGYLKQRLWLNKFKMIGVLFFSPYLWLLPDPFVDLHTVVGSGIEMPTINHPTKSDVNHYHEIYVQNLVRIFNQYKSQYHVEGELELF